MLCQMPWLDCHEPALLPCRKDTSGCHSLLIALLCMYALLCVPPYYYLFLFLVATFTVIKCVDS